MRFSLAVVAALAGLASAAPSPISLNFAVHEKRDGAPVAWEKHSRAVKDQVLPIRVGLRQRNLEHANRFIEEVADPDSPRYGQHWSSERVANMFAPAKETSDRIVEWLSTSGIGMERLKHSVGRNWIEFEGTVAEAERLFNTKYHVYRHKTSNGFRIACDEYSLPLNVKEHVDFVMPTIALDGLKPVANARPVLIDEETGATGLTGTSNCSGLATIQCLRKLYEIPVSHTAHAGNELGIAEWADYLYLPDLKIFFENYTSPPIPPDTTPQFISIDGGRHSNLSEAQMGNVIESALDFQTSYSIIWPQGIRLYQNGDSINVDSVGTFNIFLDALDGSYCSYLGGDQPYVDPAYPDPNEGGYTGPLQCGGAPMSNVFSVSYGQIEAALPRFYQERQCHEWMKLALQGVSVIYASGDSGVANRYNSGYNNSCVNPEYGFVTSGPDGTQFSPSFPVNCPYITAVGATELKSNNLAEGEKAVGEIDAKNALLDFYSGGGFSNVFERPSWQSAAVETYLSKYAPKYGSGDSVYNSSGRGFPDVSALGLHLATVYLGKTIGVGGTSASAPIFASIVTLLNEERLSMGKKPIGFLNPTIYKNPQMFHDITEGGNPGCGTQGFPAAPGWDPVTGMGTPIYPKMKEVFCSLP